MTAWTRYDAYQRHPFDTSTGMEGGCHHCGGPARSVLHEEPYAEPLPEPPPAAGEAKLEWLDTATYDEPERDLATLENPEPHGGLRV